MKQLLCTIVFTLATILASAQMAESSGAGTQTKMYFPATLFLDSLAFEKQMPLLAKEVAATYKAEKKRTYFDNATAYHLLAGDYPTAVSFIDSVQKIDGNPAYDIDLKSYAAAKASGGDAFEAKFKKEFARLYTPISFRRKVRMALSDSTELEAVRMEYKMYKEKLGKNKSDSLTLEEARSLVEKYFYNQFYNETFGWVRSMTNDRQYQSLYPAIKTYKWAGVVPVKDIDEKPDPTQQYKLLMELTSFSAKPDDTTAKSGVNAGLGEVGRLINLHAANGIPQKNMHVVAVVHASALYALLNNEKYRQKYGLDNPNIALIKELQNYGAKLIVCGQAMTFLQIEKEDLLPGIKQALTAQTVLSSYQLQNYVYYDLSLHE